MTSKYFVVTYEPFTGSDLTAEEVVPAQDERDAKNVFLERHIGQQFAVVSVRPR
jgi:hypothetical protein